MTHSKTIAVRLSGGFHGASEITVRARIESRIGYHETYRANCDGTTTVEVTRPSILGAALSDSQIARIQRHFCGMDCTCGGVLRADIDLPDGWDTNASLIQSAGLHFVAVTR